MRRVAVLCAAPLAFLLAACGGSAKPVTPGAPPAPSASSCVGETCPGGDPGEAAAGLAPTPAPTGPAGSAAHDGTLTVTAQTIHAEKQASYPGGLPDPDYPQHGWFVVAQVLEQNTGTAPAMPGEFYVQTADGSRWDSVVEPAHDPELQSGGAQPVAAGDQNRGSVVFDSPDQHGQLVYAQAGVPVFRWTF